MNASTTVLRVVVRPISIDLAEQWLQEDSTSETHKYSLKRIIDKYHDLYLQDKAVQIFELMYATDRSDKVLAYLPFILTLDHKRSEQRHDGSKNWYISSLGYHAKTDKWIAGNDYAIYTESDVRTDYVIQSVLTMLDTARTIARNLADTGRENGVAYEGAVTRDVIYDSDASDSWLADSTELRPFVYAAGNRFQSWLNGRKNTTAEKELFEAFSGMLVGEGGIQNAAEDNA